MDDKTPNNHILPPVEAQNSELNNETVAAVQGEQATTATGAPDPTPTSATFLPPATPLTYNPQDDADISAEDVDLIEKAWVEKAKAIVRETSGDPYNQNKQLNKVKAEYIKKRYNRDIKVAE